MVKRCSLNAAAGNDCGPNRGLEEFIKLNSCIDDITAHLAKCHLSKEHVQERDLILARAGLCFLGEKQIECMTICRRHRHPFGKFWRPPTNVTKTAYLLNMHNTCSKLMHKLHFFEC